MKRMGQKNIFCLPRGFFMLFILISLFYSDIFSRGSDPLKNIGTRGTENMPPEKDLSAVVPGSTPSPVALSVPFQRGINLIGWFDEPRAGQININRYSDWDFEIFKAMGIDAVRLPIDLLHMAGPAPDYTLDPLFLEFLDIAIDRAGAAGFYIVLDNHTWDPVIDTDPAIEPVLLAAWTQMASRLKNRPNLILYEVLNEPHNIHDSLWYAIQERAIQAIRAEDEFHTIVVTPANWSSCYSLADMPEYSDNNLMYTFHFYEPHLFTHQGTTWGDPIPSDLTGVPFPYEAASMPSLPASLAGTWWENLYNEYPLQGNEVWVKSQLDIAIEFQLQRDVPLLCGEFGAFPPPSPSHERAEWTSIVKNYMEQSEIAWIYLTDWFFERGKPGCFDTDLDTMIISALGLEAPVQTEPATDPETSGFIYYDDFMADGLMEDGWTSGGKYDLYSNESPKEGESCLKISDLEQYGSISFRYCSSRNLSYLADQGSTLDFWIRCASPEMQIDIRFDDTKTSDANDHPWRNSITLNSSFADWDGEWHHLSIPLNDFMETGSWDMNQWYDPQGLFDWAATDKLTIVAEGQALIGTDIFFDNIRISEPTINATPENTFSGEYQLHQNTPNPFDLTTTISYWLNKPARVSLRIYDTAGREIAKLADGYQIAGRYSVKFDASDLDNGIYYYQLNVENEVSGTRRMVLLR